MCRAPVQPRFSMHPRPAVDLVVLDGKLPFAHHNESGTESESKAESLSTLSGTTSPSNESSDLIPLTSFQIRVTTSSDASHHHHFRRGPASGTGSTVTTLSHPFTSSTTRRHQRLMRSPTPKNLTACWTEAPSVTTSIPDRCVTPPQRRLLHTTPPSIDRISRQAIISLGGNIPTELYLPAL